MDTTNLLDFDELKLYFGEDYWATDKIKILQPTIGDILEFGDSHFYSIINSICGNTTTHRLMLWKAGIDWNEYSDFELFYNIIKSLKPEDTYLIFGDINLSWFDMFHNSSKDCNELIYIPRDENNMPIQDITYENTIVIDELVYIKIVEYLRLMFDIHPKVEKAKGKATKQAIIDEEEMNLQVELSKREKEPITKSILLPLISAALNHPGFKYKKNELKDVGIVEFMDSIKRLQIYESTHALLGGMYSGFVDVKGINKDEFNFMRPIN